MTYKYVDASWCLSDPAAGSSLDWAIGTADIRYAYVFELRDTGTHGFTLPASQIRPTAREIWFGLKAMINAGLDEAKRQKRSH